MNVLNLSETLWEKDEICMDMLLKTPLNPMRKIKRKYSIL
jgi:hypothetical protein